jgi:hypothetical protein
MDSWTRKRNKLIGKLLASNPGLPPEQATNYANRLMRGKSIPDGLLKTDWVVGINAYDRERRAAAALNRAIAAWRRRRIELANKLLLADAKLSKPDAVVKAGGMLGPMPGRR